jgi:membrane dipeptidase
MSLAHNGNNQLADSHTGERDGYLYNNGISPLGRQVLAEMNRLGIMVDVSHPSKGANLEAMRLSKAPVMASHSGIRAQANVSRNMDDEQLLALKKNGGVIQVVGLSAFVKPDPPERAPALTGLREEFAATAAPAPSGPRPCPREPAPATTDEVNRVAPDKRAEYQKRLAEIDAKWPAAGTATVKDFVDRIDYAVKLIGISLESITSGSLRISTAAAASKGGTAPRKRLMSRWNWYDGITASRRLRNCGAGIYCACGPTSKR